MLQTSQYISTTSLALRNLVMEKDIFLSLPTGSGKTCYAILPELVDCYNGTSGSIVVVISPLLSLMKDEVQLLNSIGITAAYIGSDQDNESIVEGVKHGTFQIVSSFHTRVHCRRL